MIRYSTFTEEETRVFSPSPTLSSAINAVCNGSADGLTVDVITVAGDVYVSHEVQPNMPIDSWYGDDLYQ